MKLDPARLRAPRGHSPAPLREHWLRTVLLVLAALLSAPFVLALTVTGRGKRR